jgi:Na+/H+ antiporter NhaD/arsenite permease-like protein
MSATLAVAVFLGAYALIASEKANRVAVALTGAGLMLALGLLSSEDAFHSEEFGIDWDVIFLLLGMMIIVGVIKQTGLFDYLAIWSAKRARGSHSGSSPPWSPSPRSPQRCWTTSPPCC